MTILERLFNLIPKSKKFDKDFREFWDSYINNITPGFDGWGMKTHQTAPWINGEATYSLLEANDKIKKSFNFQGDSVNSETIDTLLWRHWNVCFCIDYALRSVEEENQFCGVECGVAHGRSAFFALYELENRKAIFNFHLIDSWDSMDEKLLSEKESVKDYAWLDKATVSKNLSSFNSQNLHFHKGYIPEVLEKNKKLLPSAIHYLHIDLNSSMPTIKTLDFFFNKLSVGGVILFDDYGFNNHSEMRNDTWKYFENLGKEHGTLFINPTGQAIFFKFQHLKK